MPKKAMDGKKVRWTRAQKLEAKRSEVRAQRDDRDRGQRRDQGAATRTDRRDRTDRREGAPSGRDRYERRDRAPRRDGEDRGAGRRDYAARDDRRDYSRDDRRSDRRWSNDRDDRRSTDRRDDRGGDRPARRSYRDDRRPSYRDDRRDDRRPAYRDDRRDDRRSSFRDDRWDERRDDRRPAYRDDRRDERRSSFRDDRRDDRRPAYRNDRRDDRRPSFRDDRSERRDYDRPRREDRATEPRTAPVREQRSAEPISLEGNGFAALELPEVLVERLARDGITAPFPIQVATIPDALAGRDVLGRGRTGSGKTLSFGLPMLTRLAKGGKARPGQPRAIVLVPTRELAMQVSDALQPLVHIIGLRHKLVAGGMPYEPQLSALERGVDVLIATPGRLIDLMERGAADLSRVEIAVLDEADHMAEMGFLEAIQQILDQVPTDGQRLLFSATLDRGIDTVVEQYLTDPVEHATDDGTASVDTMDHHALLIEPRYKKAVTAEVANRPGRTVVFVRTKLGADRVAGELRDQGVMAAALHGGLNQSQRNKVLGAFKDGKVPVLVATDVAARGIHVDDVGVVLQVDPPADHKDYLHRAGRTARAGEKGTVVTLALPHQRRTMQRLLDEAGVGTSLQNARPGDDVIRATGGSTPQGAPISEQDLQRLISPPRASRGGRSYGDRGPRQGGRGRYGDRNRRDGSSYGGRDRFGRGHSAR
ncbi:DEAD/DEAH box helicase [Flexivirga caeni]|uniref:DEAD/DEAH box helicase n=1 Tax=Flexivirga caeni TaxID=2294115 RepID=A0A3M9MDE1_9MICO|nr:DEAD/DEAH box helicase [Flexivirga caeni]RNI23225.1 DEAD/DEAH box helicase [Flexivirga caeni]